MHTPLQPPAPSATTRRSVNLALLFLTTMLFSVHRATAPGEPPALEITLINPTNPAVRLRWTTPPPPTNSQIEMHQVQVSSNLLHWTNLGGSIPRNPDGTQQKTIPLTNTHAFYRLSSHLYDGSPGPTVLHPPTATRSNTIVLAGQTSPRASIRVEGAAVTLNTTADDTGAYSLQLLLAPNRLNRLLLTATHTNGFHSLATSINILHDAQPPLLFIDFPTNGATLATSNIVIAGRVRDPLSGPTGLAVHVASLPATIHNGTFERPITLAQGSNFLTLTANDRFANTTNQSLTLFYQPPPADQPRLITLAGDMQAAPAGSRLPQPIVVQALQANGTPISGLVLDLEVTGSNGRLLPVETNAYISADAISRPIQFAPSYTSNGVLTLQLRTDTNGQARAHWTLGTKAGRANNRLSVSAPGISNNAYFCASAQPGAPKRIHLASGHNQRIPTRTIARQPLRVRVSDSQNGVAGIPVTFRILRGTGLLRPVDPVPPPGAEGTRSPGSTEVTVLSSEDGYAEASYEAGTEEDTEMVEATSNNDPAQSTTFTVSTIQTDPNQPTFFHGLVLNEAQEPLRNARCVLTAGGVARETFSSPVGRFSFTQLFSGPAELTVFGDTVDKAGSFAIPPDSYGNISYRTELIPNAANELPHGAVILHFRGSGAPAETATAVSSTRSEVFYNGVGFLELTDPAIPGLKLTIRPETMHHPDGTQVTPTRATLISVKLHQNDKLPVLLPFGASPKVTWKLEPEGATFLRKVTVELPNPGFESGEPVSIMKYDSAGGWIEVADGEVSKDGRQIRSERFDGLESGGLFTVASTRDPPVSVNHCVQEIVGPAYVHVGRSITLQSEGVESAGWEVTPFDGLVSEPDKQAGTLTFTGITPGDVFVKVTALTPDQRVCRGERIIRVLPRFDDIFPRPPTHQNVIGGQWSIDTVEVSDDDGVTLRNIKLHSPPHAPRILARFVSLPYISLKLKDRPQPLRLELRPNDNQQNERSRLTDFSITSDADKIIIHAQYVIDGIPDANHSAALRVHQKYVFVKHDPEIDCNSNEATCARFYPLIEYTYEPGILGEPEPMQLEHVSFPQRFEFSVDGLPNRCGMSRDEPDVHSVIPTEGNDFSTITFEPDGHNPTRREFLTNGIGQGEDSKVDHFHQTWRKEIVEPEASQFLTEGHDGCPECVHIHWRWSILTTFVEIGTGGRNFDSYYGEPIIPQTSKQSLTVGHCKKYFGEEEDPPNWRRLIEDSPEPYNLFTGEDLVFWHEGSSPHEHDEFFLYGVFFLPENKLHEESSRLSPEHGGHGTSMIPGSIRSPIRRAIEGELPPLDHTWTVRVNGRNARATASGSFVVTDVPVADPTPEWVRVSGHSTANGAVRYITSDFFQMPSSDHITPPNLRIGPTPPRSPISLSASLDTPHLATLGQTTQMRVTAHYTGGHSSNATPASAFTTYRTSNPRIARVNPDGLITAVGPGGAFITALNEGAMAVVEVDVSTDATPVVSPDTGRYTRLDPETGQPINNSPVPVADDGSLPPLEFRPGGIDLTGLGQSLVFRFPNGAKLVEVNGIQMFEFTDVVAMFGPNSILQFAQPFSRSGGAPKRIGLGSLRFEDFANLFDSDPADGIPMVLFDRFPLTWQGGTVEEGGISGPRFALGENDLPLPDLSSLLPDFRINFDETDEFRLPFAGDFNLPDGSGFVLTVRFKPSNPLWVTLKPTGGILFSGRAEIDFPNGSSFCVDVKMDDPIYELQVVAKRLHIEMLDSLAGLLPAAPNGCLPTSNTDALLAEATRCLKAYARAYHNYNAIAADVSPQATQPPPTPFDAASSILEAWAFSALTPVTQSLPLDAIAALVRQSAGSASQARGFERAAAYHLALRRAQEAVARGGLEGSDGARAELDAAIAQAEAAAIQLSQDAESIKTLASARETARLLTEAETIRVQLDLPPNPQFAAAIVSLFERFANNYAQSLGVTSGTFTPQNNATINQMNRFETASAFRQTMDFMADASELGLNIPGTLLDETVGQLAVRLFQATEARLNEAEVAGDYFGFLFAVQDMFDLAGDRELALFPNVPELALLPDDEDLPGYEQRKETLMREHLDRPEGERSMRNRMAEFRALVHILREAPPGLTFAPEPLQRAYDRMNPVLGDVLSRINTESSLARLFELLEAGTLHVELGRRLSFAQTPWESQRLPALIARFGAVAEAQLAWSQIDEAIRFVIGEADLQGLASNQASRRVYLEQAVVLLGRSRAIAQQITPPAGSALAAADMLLPGDVLVKDASGAIRYNRRTHALQGTVKGRLELPNSNFFFEIVNATITSGGAYNITLAAGGDIGVGDQSRVKFTIDSMHAASEPNGPFVMDGQATLRINTGSGFANGPTVVVNAGYDSEAGEFTLGTSVTNLRLSDQIALLQGSIAASFAAEHPQGALKLSGKVGLLARQPLQNNRPLTETDFWLVVETQPTTFSYTDHDVTAQFSGGSITLPPDLFREDEPNTRQPVTVALSGQLCMRYDFVQNRLAFCGDPNAPFTLTLQDLVLELPELPGFALAIESATLELSGTQFPLLKNLSAMLTLPLPGADASNPMQNRSGTLSINAQNWRIDGLPEAASISVPADLRLADYNGFTFDVLSGSALSFSHEAADGQRHTTFAFDGNLRAGFDERVLTDDANGTALRFTVVGLFSWDMQSLPVLELNSLIFEGTFRLGTGGPRITGLQPGGLARLTFTDLHHLFHQGSGRAFTIDVEGALEVPNTIKFGLINTKFIIDGAGIRFEPGGVQLELGKQTVDVVREALPVYLSKAGLAFFNRTAPLIPTPSEGGLFDLTNIIVTISGGVNVPNQAALAAGVPGFAGEVNDLAMSLRRDAQNNLVPEFSLNGLGVQLNNVDIPPLGALTGGLYVGNLNDTPNLYFAGMVSGKVNDVGAGITMAIHRQKGLLGSCFELDIGPAGIPIDGGVLGGILLTGGKGGLSFGNQFTDPCDFREYIDFTTVNGQRQPINDGTTDTFPPTGPRPPVQVPTNPPPANPSPNSCILGEFPPSTLNPLCERHPVDTNRIIFKGTARNESDLIAIGLTRQALPSSLNAAISFAVGKLTDPLRTIRHALTNAIPPGIPTNTSAFYIDLLDKQIRQMENTAAAIIANALGNALQTNPNADLYDAIVAAVAAGIPCLDATLKLQGNFSHAAVSTVMKGEGEVIVSTTGTALMRGTIKLIGIPIGEGTLAFSLTDSAGDINPSFGGVVSAGVGPLSLGQMSLAYECDSCFDAVIGAFGAFLQANAANLAADVKHLLVEIMNRSVPVNPARPVNGDVAAMFLQLTPRQQLGYVVSLFNVVDVFANRESIAGITTNMVSGFVGHFAEFVTEVATQVNPRFCFQAQVRPTIFGFPMVPGPTPLDARFAYERVFDTNLNQSFQQLSADAVFSPAFIISSLIVGPGAALIPTTDQANFGFSFRMPAFTETNVLLAMTNPVQFAANQFSSFVQDSVFTFGYAFMPLGIPLAEGQARIFMPRLASHPNNNNRVGGPWFPPSGATVAAPDELIIAALIGGFLQNPNWRGERGQLDDLFINSTDERIVNIRARLDLQRMAGLSFAEDYFPHGGIIGASRLQLPKMLVSAPPVALIARVFDVGSPTWVQDAQELFDTYLIANTNIGQMALYIPAPSPPRIFFNSPSNTLEKMIHDISRVDVMSIINNTAGELYAFDQLLLSGWIKAQVLGLPLAEGSIRFANGNLRVHAGVPAESWLHDFIGADAELEIRKPAFMNSTGGGSTIDQMYAATPTGSVEDRFAARRAQIQPGISGNFIGETVDMIYQTLPKARLEMEAQMQIPDYLQPILQQRAEGELTFFAFSPAYDPLFGLNGPGAQDDDNSPYAIAQRRGGLGIKGAFDLGLNLSDGDTNNDIRITLSDASFSITPDANIGAFPALSGQLKITDINLPGLPRLTDGTIGFASSPDNLAPFVTLGAKVEPFEILIPNPFGQAIPMVQFLPRNPGGIVGGNLSIFKDQSVPGVQAGARLHIDAMRVNMPMLGPDVAMTIYGHVTNGNVLTPFTFSTTSSERWSATVKIHAASREDRPPVFGICDPRTVSRDQNGNWVGDPSTCAMTFSNTAPIIAAMEGNGLQNFRLTMNFVDIKNVTFFPNSPTRTDVPVLARPGTPGVFMIEKTAQDGLPRFYVDFGQVNNLGLPGVLTASGRFEFGFNPTEIPGPLTRTPSSLSFTNTDICSPTPQVRQVTINNTRSEPVNVLLRVTQPDHYTVVPNQFAMDRNSSRTVDVLFHPRAVGTRTATLFIESDNPDSPSLSVALTGVGTATPKYFQSRNSIEFGDTVAGQVAAGTVVIGNEGCGPFSITSVAISGPQASAFTISPVTGASLGPGQSRLYRVEFAPTAVPIGTNTSLPHSATLTITTNSGGSHTVILSGNATDSRWITLMDSETAGSSAHFNDIRMLDAKNGWVVGNAGSMYQTTDGGRSWRQRILTPFNLQAIHAETPVNEPLVSAYHFEEPPGATRFRDDGPNGFHALAETNTAAPAVSYSNGRFGSGLGFDGNDTAFLVGNLQLSNSCTIALWANIPFSPGAGVLVSQTDPTINSIIFSLEITGSAFLLRFGSQSFTAGTVTDGWQHLAVTFAYNSGTDQTTARLFRGGTTLFTTNFTGPLPVRSTRILGIGARYQSFSSRVTFFTGSIDELLFFGGALSTTEISALATGTASSRLVVVGDEGTVLESDTMGRSWHKAFDLNPDGWRQRDHEYWDFDWKGVTIANGQIILGGTRRNTTGIGVNSGVIMVEDLFNNIRYNEVTFDRTPDIMFNEVISSSSGKVYAFGYGGRVFQSPPDFADPWTQHGTLDVNLPLNDATFVTSTTYVGVGTNGTMIRSVGGGDPVVINHGLTSNHLHGIDYVGVSSATVPELHVVGDNGVYLHSGDSGATWTKTADGLTGTNRAVAARVVGTGYEAWVAGDNHHIQYRPPQPQVAPFITFHPGELDFGMLTLGQSRTLPLEIRNRGKRDLNLGLSVSGSGFALVQGSVTRIAPGDRVLLQVRFKPTNEVAYAAGTLILTANEGTNQTFRVPLVGRASALEWQPVTLHISGTPITGEVLDLAFTTDLVGYALTSGSLMKTLDGGTNWTDVAPNPAIVAIHFTFRALDVRRFSGADVIYLAGKSRDTRFGTEAGVIWRSADGAANWTTRTPSGGPHPIFGDVAMLHDDPDAAVCVTSDPVNHDADVWQTTTAGVNWAKKSRPPNETVVGSTTNASFNGGRVLIEEIQNGAVPETAGWSVIATSDSGVYSRGFDNQWPYVEVFPVESGQEVLQFDTLQPINAIQFGRSTVLTTGWIVGNQGLYWRWQPIPPNRAPFAGTESEWFPASNQEVFGRTDLQAVSFTSTELNGWIVGTNKIFISKDGGQSWDLDFVTGEESSLKSIFARSATRAWAGGSFATKATVWRYRPGAVPPMGILSANDVDLFPGTILPGATLTRNIAIQNIGNATLNLHHLTIETDDRLTRFRIVGTPPATLNPGASANMQVAFDATPDPVDVQRLNPAFFHRFEQGFTDTRYFDAGPSHRDIDFDSPLVPLAQRPKIVADPLRRDRALAFDGNDYAEIPGAAAFPGDFSLSLWVNPTTTADGQMFISKHTAVAGNQLLFGFLNGGYHINLRGLGFAAGNKKTGWQHLAVTGLRLTNATTLITVYRDGEILWQQNLGNVLGTVTGLPWIIGAERDSGNVINDFLTGQLDDVAVFDHLLDEGEIQALASKSPTCGDHRAKLLIQTGSETGERAVELRATVQETAGIVVIDTVPSGAPVTVDGTSYPTPVTFAVSCTASTPKEWLEGSQHTIQVPPTVALVANGNTLTYGFASWNLQNATQPTLSLVARSTLGRLIATYRLESTTSPSPAPESAFALLSEPPPAADPPSNLVAAVGGTPAGPWFRLSNGRLSIPNLGTDGFAITGELFATLSRIKGHVTSTPLTWPDTGTRFLELGPAEWQVDMLAGSHFRMRTRPPALTLLGNDTAPDGEFQLNFDLIQSRYIASFILREDFRPLPNLFELGQGAVAFEVQLPQGQTPIFAMDLDGRVRFLRLPNNTWAVDQTAHLDINTANFNISLRTTLGTALPAQIFNLGPIALLNGDVRLSRNNNGPILLTLTNLDLHINGPKAATVSGSISTDTTLALNGSIAGHVDLLPGGKFFLQSRTGNPVNFSMLVQALPAPRMALDLPTMELHCIPGEGVPEMEVNVPALAFDTSGTFDTGKIPLPTGLVFDGITIDKPSDAELDDNYIRLSRDTAGKVAFKIRAQQRFHIPGVVDCRNKLKVTIDNNDLSASYRGNFCVLPEPISLSFDGNSSCQFSGSAFGQTIFFGSGCIGIQNDATGACLGTCQ